jgi:hypothetical protein
MRAELRENVCKAFCVAVLLSGDMAIAEEAVHEAILSLDMEDLPTEALYICVATLSIQRSYGLATAGIPALMKMPKELLDVLNLPRLRRQCFVLRFLVGLPESICASLLQMDRNEVCDATCAALSDLAAAGEQRIGRVVCLPMVEKAVQAYAVAVLESKIDSHHPIG